MEQKIEEGSLAHQISFELFVQNDSAQRSIFKARSGSRFQFSQLEMGLNNGLTCFRISAVHSFLSTVGEAAANKTGLAYRERIQTGPVSWEMGKQLKFYNSSSRISISLRNFSSS